MTYMPSSASNQTAANVASLTILHNSSTDIAITAGSVVPLGSSIQSYGSDSYTVSSGEITLSSGSYYLVRAVLASYGPTVWATKLRINYMIRVQAHMLVAGVI